MNTETPLEHQIKILEALLAKKPVEFRPKVGQHAFRRLDPDDTWFIHWDQFEFRLPPKIASGHNPANLPESVVEIDRGYRLLDPDEVKPRRPSSGPPRSIIEKYCFGYGWEGLWLGDCRCDTYRTKLSREELAKYDIPQVKRIIKKRVPCTSEDFPPGTIITRTTWGNTARASVLYVDADVIAYFSPITRATMTPFSELVMQDFFRSLDGGKTWLPCYKEI